MKKVLQSSVTMSIQLNISERPKYQQFPNVMITALPIHGIIDCYGENLSLMIGHIKFYSFLFNLDSMLLSAFLYIMKIFTCATIIRLLLNVKSLVLFYIQQWQIQDFPFGGCQPIWGALTSNAYTFQ